MISDREIWSYKFEPKEIKGMILNREIKPKLEKSLKEVPNLMLYGNAGVGKSTFAHILLNYTKYSKLWINASDHSGIDFIRDIVKPFSTSASMTDMKIVVLNEADSLSRGAQGAQKMLKQLMEDVQQITRFVFLTNDITLMMDELQSRCNVIKVDNPPAQDIAKFCINILRKEKIRYKTETVVSIVKKSYPDIRKAVDSLRENVIGGKLMGDAISSSEGLWKRILDSTLRGDIDTVRKELKSNYIDYPSLYKYFYENVGEFKEPGGAILAIGEHLKYNRDYPIKEINFIHMVVNMLFDKVI